jgi:hypothetical protein
MSNGLSYTPDIRRQTSKFNSTCLQSHIL